jgi:acetolactate synthase-1/2/3 large subunit
MTKYAVQVNDSSTIRYHLEKACLEATTGRPGPVWIDIPLNIQSANINPEELTGYTETIDTPKASKDDIKHILQKLSQAKKPILIVGNGVRLAKAEKELDTFLSLCKIPVLTAVNGNDLVNESYENYAGRFGTHAQICANNLLNECDLVLSIGSRLYVRQTGYNFKSFAKNAYRIYSDIDLEELRKPTLFPDCIVQSDAKYLLEELNKQSIFTAPEEWQTYIQSKYKSTPVVLDRHRENKKSVSNYHFIEKLNNHLSETDHIVTSDGSANVVTMQVAKLKGKQRLITNTGCAPMGYGLPAAIGASSNETRVICLEGDGSLHLNIHELQTVKHNNLPIKLIILNNNGYLSIKISQKTFFNGRYVASEQSSGVSFPNYKKLVAAYDLPYFSIRKHTQIDNVLEEFLKGNTPAVLEVFTDSEEYHEPKVVASLDEKGNFIPGELHNIQWIQKY